MGRAAPQPDNSPARRRTMIGTGLVITWSYLSVLRDGDTVSMYTSDIASGKEIRQAP
jgi:hypothetical protein